MTRTKEDAHKQILAFRHDLVSGKAAFADLASRESHCSSARRGGEPLLHAMMPLNLLGGHVILLHTSATLQDHAQTPPFATVSILSVKGFLPVWHFGCLMQRSLRWDPPKMRRHSCQNSARRSNLR